MRIKVHSNRHKRVRAFAKELFQLTGTPTGCPEVGTCYQWRKVSSRRNGTAIQARLWPGSLRDIIRKEKDNVSSSRALG